jgi:uncharacterized protein
MKENTMEQLTHQDGERILERNHLGRLACYSPSQDTSYIVPVTYAYHGGSIYLAMLPGQKLNFLREHPQGVSFEVDEITNDETWLSVIATGVACSRRSAGPSALKKSEQPSND